MTDDQRENGEPDQDSEIQGNVDRRSLEQQQQQQDDGKRNPDADIQGNVDRQP